MRRIPSFKLLQPLVRGALGIAVLTGLLIAAGPGEVWAHLGQANPWWLALATPLYAASLLVRGLRWHLLVRPLHPRGGWLDTTATSTLGWSLNNVLPLRLGEIARLYLMSVRGNVRVASLLPSALAERVLDVVCLLGAVATGLFLLGFPALAQVPAPALAFSVAALLGLGLISVLWRLAPARIAGMLVDYRRATEATLRGPTVIWAMALTILAWVLQGLQYATFFWALGVQVNLFPLAMGFAAFMLTFAVNFVPGQVGTYEAFFVAVFSAALAADPELLLAIALATHTANALLLSLLGVASYLRLGVGTGILRTAWQIRWGVLAEARRGIEVCV